MSAARTPSGSVGWRRAPARAGAPRNRAPGLRRFLDAEGRLKVWPGKLKDQKLVLAHLATCFEPGRDYTERQVNEVLIGSHTFGDWVSLRRALIDYRFLARESDGSRYWRLEAQQREA
ncbi:MAG TPA: DUF2087 domain-containing protein [Candidatus Eisenbacteria bacterium]